jgi:hypothetical protein
MRIGPAGRQPTGPPETSPFLALLATSHRRVLPIRAVASCCELVHRHLGAKVSSRLIMVLWSALVPGVAAAMLVFDIGVWNVTLLAVGAYSVLLFLLFYYPETSWTAVQRVGPDVDGLVPDIPGKQKLADWLAELPSLRAQAIVSSVGAAVGLVFAILLVHARNLNTLTCAPFLLQTAIVGGLGLNTVWWLWQAGPLAHLLLSAPTIDLDWSAPAETPGIALSRLLLTQSARRALFGALITLAPIIIIALVGRTSAVILSVVFGVSVIAFTTIVFALLLPGYLLTLIVSRFEAALFATFRASLADHDPVHPRATTYQRLALFHVLASKRTVPLDIKFILSLVVALLSASASLAALIVSIAR